MLSIKHLEEKYGKTAATPPPRIVSIVSLDIDI